jgi:hypothetical protein
VWAHWVWAAVPLPPHFPLFRRSTLQSELLTEKEAAAFLNISRATVWRLAQAGKLAVVHLTWAGPEGTSAANSNA